MKTQSSWEHQFIITTEYCYNLIQLLSQLASILPNVLVSWAPPQNFPRIHGGKTLQYSVYIQITAKYTKAHVTSKNNTI
jgi:hypothetical protein